MLGNTPFINRGGQDDPSRLFYSNQNQALTKPISIPGGFGVVKSGAVMGKISESTNRLGYYTPYTPEAPSVGLANPWGFANLLADVSSGTTLDVLLADSYKFAVGDHLALADDTNYAAEGNGVKDLGAITAIDRTTYTHKAVITITTAVDNAYAISDGAAVWIQTTTASPHVKALGVLFASVDTGEGEDSKGGDGVLIVGNAMLYKDLLYHYDSEALADMSWGREDGQFLIF